MPRVVTVFGRKGGIGKTTTALGVAACCADTLRVVLIDVDPQGAGGATKWLDGYHTRRFDHARTRDHRDLTAVTQLGDYDLVIVDTPRSDDPLTRSCLGLSDLVICPASASHAELTAAVESATEIPPHVSHRVLLTRIDARSSGDFNAACDALDRAEIPRFTSHVRLRKAHVRAQDEHLPIDRLDTPAAADAVNDYRAVAAELTGLLARQLAGRST